MTTRVLHGVEHVPHGTPEFVGDSKRWIDHVHLQSRHGVQPWVDLNWIGKWNTHYLYPLRHGFTDPDGKLHPDTPITKMTDAEVARLVAVWEGKRYRISTIEENVTYAHDLGIKAEVEEKRRQSLTAIERLHSALSHPDWTQIKVGMWLPGLPVTWLEPAHKRFKTIALTHGERGDDNPTKYNHLPADAEQYINYYRGWPPVWV